MAWYWTGDDKQWTWINDGSVHCHIYSVKNQDNLTCLRLVNFALVLYTVAFIMPARPVKFIRCCLTHLISKPLGSFEIKCVRQYLVKAVLFGIRTSEMTVKLNNNLFVRPVNIFPDLWHCIYVSLGFNVLNISHRITSATNRALSLRPSFPGMGIPMLKIRRWVRRSYL